MSNRGKTLLCLIVLIVLPYCFFYNGSFPIDLIEDGEGMIYNYPLKMLSAQIIRSGSCPLWNPYLVSGSPLLADIEAGTLYPLTVLLLFLSPIVAFNLFMYLHYVMAGIFTFFYLRSLKAHHLAALFSGITFMFSGFLIAQLGHSSCQNAAVWLPLIFFCIEKFRQKLSFNYFVLGTFAFACQILSGFPQLVVYTAVVIVFYLCFIRKKIMFVAGFGILIIGICLSAIQILPTAELVNMSFRKEISYDFFTARSFPPKLIPLFFFPYLFGSHALGFYHIPYWGQGDPVECAPYIGILPLCLGVIAFLSFRRGNLNIKFWSFIALLALLLILGENTPLYRMLYYIPIYNFFRVPARHLFEFHFAIAVLSGMGLSAILTNSGNCLIGINKAINIITKILTIVVVTIVGFITAFHLTKSPMSEKYLPNFSFKNPAIYLPLIIIFLSVCVLLFLRKKRESPVVLTLILILLFFDLFSFGHFFNPRGTPAKDMTDTEHYRPAVKYLLEKEEKPHSYRTIIISSFPLEDAIEIIHPNTNFLYPISSVNTFTALILKDHYKLLKMVEEGFSDSPLLLANNKVLSMLNVKYIISTLFPSEKIELLSQTRKPAIMKRFFRINPGVSYKTTLLAKAPSEPTQDVVIGVLGSWFDTPQVKLTVPPAELSPQYREFSLQFDGSDIVGSEFYLQVSTFSSSPVFIKNIRLTEMGKENNLLFDENFYPDDSLYTKRYTKDVVTIFENRNVLPRAYLVSKLIKVKDLEETCSILWNGHGSFDPHKEALVEADEVPILEQGEGSCEVIDYQPNKTTIETNSETNKFLVLSETYYPGWNTYLDGKAQKIYKTNGVLRGVFVPKGRHFITFIYDPLLFKFGAAISLITFIGLITGLICTWKRNR